MDPLVIVVTVVAVILSLVLLVVGVQTILVLQQVRVTLQRVNHLTEIAEVSLNKVSAPLQNLGGMMEGMKTGFRMLELFSTFLKRQVESPKSKSSAVAESEKSADN